MNHLLMDLSVCVCVCVCVRLLPVCDYSFLCVQSKQWEVPVGEKWAPRLLALLLLI